MKILTDLEVIKLNRLEVAYAALVELHRLGPGSIYSTIAAMESLGQQIAAITHETISEVESRVKWTRPFHEGTILKLAQNWD